MVVYIEPKPYEEYGAPSGAFISSCVTLLEPVVPVLVVLLLTTCQSLRAALMTDCLVHFPSSDLKFAWRVSSCHLGGVRFEFARTPPHLELRPSISICLYATVSSAVIYLECRPLTRRRTIMRSKTPCHKLVSKRLCWRLGWKLLTNALNMSRLTSFEQIFCNHTFTHCGGSGCIGLGKKPYLRLPLPQEISGCV